MRNGRARRARRGGEHGGPAVDPTRQAATGAPVIPGYTDLEVIGHGASATVYRAMQEGYDRQVAVKVLNVDVSDRRAQRRFQRERALNGRLSDHPNVVTVLDSGFVDGRHPYLAMELFELGSLTDHLRTRGPFDVAAALHIGVRIAGALESAHRLGVLHRDVKPQNVLQSRFGEPALADFGIAAILEMEHSLTAALTPVHAAPELLEGSDPSERTDVYALASTIYTVLAGSPPFAGPPGEGMLAQLLRITTSDLPALARADVPASLVETLRHALAKRPAERTEGAAEFGRALQRVQAELGLAVTPLPVDGATTDPTPGRPVTAASTPAPAPPASVAPPSASAVPSPATAVSTAAPSGSSLAPPAGVPAAHPLATPLAPARPLAAPVAASSFAAFVAEAPAVSAPLVPVAVTRSDEVVVEGHTIDAPTVTARHVSAAPPVPLRRRRWVVPAACAGALVIGASGVVGAVALFGGDGEAAAPSTTIAPSTTTAATLPADVTALAPTGLSVSTDTGRVLLTWTDATGGRAPQVVYTYPVELGVGPSPVAAGTTSLVVPGVGVDTPACFIVAAVVSIGQDASAPARTANSAPSCINGAVARP